MSARARHGATPFALQRLGVVMEPEPDVAAEAWGVLNPAAARGPDGDLYLFPRLVAEGNYSRIGRARVCFDAAGRPIGVERLGLALEPQEPYERNALTGGGVEDPRITFLQPLRRYVMTYTAFGPQGPRIALATSPDLRRWERLGLLRFAPTAEIDLNGCPNKDSSFFPQSVRDPQGQPALALLHRPTLPTLPAAGATGPTERPATPERRESIWISYVPLERAQAAPAGLLEARDHAVLATPQQPWEALKIGGGPPPLRTPLGWLVLYHGVSGRIMRGLLLQPRVRYSAGVLVLDAAEVRTLRYRSPRPILAPEQPEERVGMVPNVVFPTGADTPHAGTVDVYYGMADARIGAARLTLPAALPPT
jgi:predicted GH43/DUF377 family glycosyl hydrolase